MVFISAFSSSLFVPGGSLKVKRVLFNQDEDQGPLSESECSSLLSPLPSDSFKPLDGAEVFYSLPVGLSDMSLEVLNSLTDDIQPGNHHSFDDQPVPSYQDSAGASLEKENSSLEVAVNLSITSDGDFNPSSTSTAKKKQTRTYNAPDEITRKRLANPQNWKKNVNKEKIARGEEYVTFKGKTIKELGKLI